MIKIGMMIGDRYEILEKTEQAEAVCAAIRATLADLYGAEVAEEMRVLYGGSMNPGNVEGLMAQPNIDGGLIGGASLKAASFVQLINACL